MLMPCAPLKIQHTLDSLLRIPWRWADSFSVAVHFNDVAIIVIIV